ncbi:phospholipase A2, membrane associated-like [Erinaceus europaeus]|uniref:Phospholipase A2 n=1 Tax=Erinaceus europaeus TaxID=9365 RepID=A0A1S3AH66_ERIEU|nr:phospholipase A2, membrane associated-like [Erinaceus europaeus]
MKAFLLAMTVTFGLLQVHGDLWNFGKMVWKSTGKNIASSFGLYGCHCHWGGKGAPRDATDWCCAEHDCCYRRLAKQGCQTRALPYKADYSGGQIHCEEQDACSAQKCECDKTAALCFAKNLDTYNKTYQFYSRRKCRGKAPQC